MMYSVLFCIPALQGAVQGKTDRYGRLASRPGTGTGFQERHSLPGGHNSGSEP